MRGFRQKDNIIVEGITKEAPEEITEVEEELGGDENIHSFIMPDGSVNYKYIQLVEQATAELELEELQETILPFSQFPQAIKQVIYRRLEIGLILVAATLFFTFSNTVNWTLPVVLVLLSGFMFFAAYAKYRAVKYIPMVKFEGIIISIDQVGIFKTGRYYVIKIADEKNNKFLNVKLGTDKGMDVGSPITIYLAKDEKIVDSEYGPMAETVMGYSLNVFNEEDSKMFKTGEVSADDYINK